MREITGRQGAPHDDALGQIGNTRPLGDLRDVPVGGGLHLRFAVAVDLAPPDGRVGGDRHEDEQVGVTVGRHRRVDAARFADVERRGVRDAGVRAEDAVEADFPLLGEEHVVVLELRHLALDPQVYEKSTRAGGALVPVLLRVRLQLARKQGRLGVVQVGRRHDDVGVEPLGRAGSIRIFHARRTAVVGNEDACHPSIRDDLHPLGPRQLVDTLDKGGQPAHRVEHAVGQVEVAHEVIHARGDEGRRPEEHRGKSEDLAQTVVFHGLRDKGGERLEQQAREPRHPSEHIAAHERP